MSPYAQARAREVYGPALRVLVRAGFAKRLGADFDCWAVGRALELLCADLPPKSRERQAAEAVIAHPRSLRSFCIKYPWWLRNILEEAR